jgi:medium-chain acyl-[acyl-carrier-protein] hydrolase
MASFSKSHPSAAPTWTSLPKPNPGAAVRLFCFPYAGAGSNIYHKWAESLPDRVELCLVHLPGRERRLKEPPFGCMSELVRALERPLLPYLDRPAAFWGHSMGGLISFELARHYRRAYGLRPAQLFISATGAPRRVCLPAPLQDPQPVDFLREMQGLSQASRLTADRLPLFKMMLPTLKADMAMCASYGYQAEAPLDCPITAFGGLDDCQVKCEDLDAWREETAGRFALRMFRGDHFFIHSAESQVLKALSEELLRLAETA